MASRFQSIRDFVETEIKERDSEPKSPLFPSDYWKDFNRFSSYVRNLPDKDLQNIRYHTFHLTGDIYTSYHFTNQRRIEQLVKSYLQSLDNLEGFWPCEPDGGIGVMTKYGVINSGITRYALVLSDLVGTGILDRRTPASILEIGGGYGGLALMCRQFNPNSAYVVCDLEESLFYQGVFLNMHLGEDYVHPIRGHRNEFESMQEGHVYLLPQRHAESLSDANFDLVINQQSMQEMTREQVSRYSDIISLCAEKFYSCNMDSHGKGIVSSKGTISSLHEFLGQRFDVEWNSKVDESFLVRLIFSSRLMRSLIKRIPWACETPQGEAALDRFIYRCR